MEKLNSTENYEGGAVQAMSPGDFRLFRELIHRNTGIWLRDGKQVMLASRLSRRLRHHALHSFSEYYRYVNGARDGGGELRELINCVTTNKTSFFREEHHFEFLAREMVPALQRAAQRGAAKSMRIWSAACSTGEEPYSIVITVLEALGAQRAQWSLQVVASDIDTAVLRRADEGVYDSTVLGAMETSLRARYFLRGSGDCEGQVKVKPELTRHVLLQQLNLMEPVWQLEGKFDAIFFRNALIYFRQETQELFLRRMLRYLKPEGYLILGHSEHIPWLHDAVAPLPKTIYRLRGGWNEA